MAKKRQLWEEIKLGKHQPQREKCPLILRVMTETIFQTFTILVMLKECHNTVSSEGSKAKI